MKYFLLYLSILLISAESNILCAQPELTLYSMYLVPQSIRANPAFRPKANFYLGLPIVSSQYFSIVNSGFKIRDLFEIENETTLTVDIDRFIDNLKPQNFFILHYQTDLLSFGIKIKKNYFTFSSSENFYSRFIYPKGFFQLAWLGNGAFLGERLSMDGLGFDFVHYRDYCLGMSREWDSHWTFGLRLKFLYGMESIYTRKSNLGLTTDKTTYALTFDGSMEVNTSGFMNEINPNTEFDPKRYVSGLKNRGFGIDMGCEYKFNDKLTVSGSLIDLGWIRWKDRVKNYTQKDFRLTFNGLTLSDFFQQNDTVSKNTSDVLLDSASTTFQINQNNESYTTALMGRGYASGTYRITPYFWASSIIHGEFIKGVFRPSHTLTLNFRIRHFISVALSHSFYNRNIYNAGAGVTLNIWLLQFYIVTDNFLLPIYPDLAKNFNLHLGFNLTLGRMKGK